MRAPLLVTLAAVSSIACHDAPTGPLLVTSFLDLGTLGGAESTAYGINDAGQVVGGALLADGAEHAFLWTRELRMVDLGTLGGRNSVATGINNRGQVVGRAQLASGDFHAFLWTPD